MSETVQWQCRGKVGSDVVTNVNDVPEAADVVTDYLQSRTCSSWVSLRGAQEAHGWQRKRERQRGHTAAVKSAIHRNQGKHSKALESMGKHWKAGSCCELLTFVNSQILTNYQAFYSKDYQEAEVLHLEGQGWKGSSTKEGLLFYGRWHGFARVRVRHMFCKTLL